MKEYDLKIEDESIKNSIIDDSLNRNTKINKLVEVLNGINTNRIIAIDGKWGCGKTVFLKQLEYVRNNTIDTKCQLKIYPEIIDEFRKKYLIQYYNAWENDYHSSPLLSLIFTMLIAFPKAKNKTASGKIESPFNFRAALKTISGELYDPNRVESYEDMTSEIINVEKKKEALNNLINEILPDNKRLIVIIDELDRCRPDYAISMLETIKHFYLNDRLVFLIGVNNEQLSYTISNYYGSNFDGYGYLNKFYDLIVELDEITPSMYLEGVMKKHNSGDWINIVLHSLCNYHNFQMREINRLLNDYDMLNECLKSNNVGLYDEEIMLKYLFLPYCLALKIKSKEELRKFLEGSGYAYLEKFVKSNSKLLNIVWRGFEDCNSNINRNELTDDDMYIFLKNKYSEYFVSNSLDFEKKKYKAIFLDMFSLISNYTIIDETH